MPARVLGCATALTLLAACSGGGPAPPTPTAVVRASVVYRVSGAAPTVVVSYGNKHHARRNQVALPWSHSGSAFEGTTVALRADQTKSRFGYRIVCSLSITIPGNPPLVQTDSSHIVAIKQEGAPQKVQYDGQCNTSAVVSLTGLP